MGQERGLNRIHILFGESPAGSLKNAFRDMGIYEQERVVFFRDIFSVGPVWMLHEESGRENRIEWMKDLISDDYEEYPEYRNKFEKTIRQIQDIPDGSHIIIWHGDNAHEQTGLQYVVYLLKGKNIDISAINTTKAGEEMFPDKKVKFTPLHTGEISPETLQLIWESPFGKWLTDHDREHLEKEWLILSEDRANLRVWRNQLIHSFPEDYYDTFIKSRAEKLHAKQKEKDFMKSARLIGDVLGRLDQYVGDEFLEYRLKKMIAAGVFEAEGSLLAMRFYSVRLRQGDRSLGSF
ncbi:DUF1835 domain-containing protein [Bacillus infantis]|uniref:DUF1835 domain-containing protein n=1 Tax=Bacillus infantis TaxID=324767 RepID=UPI002FBEB2D0